jgi:hypothetical protein
MKAKLILILLWSYGAAMAQKTQKAQLYYASDKFEITTEHQQKLRVLYDSIKDFSIKIITIKGYTDTDADSIYNISLSTKRTNSVKAELVKLGIANTLIFENNYGENLAVKDSTSEQIKSKNRRVDITVWLEKKETKLIVKDTCLDGDTILAMENGTLFKLKKCNLRKMGSKIQFTETITTEQMVAQNMSTNTDDDGQLITGGMISIGNNSTNCKFDDTVTVYIPIKDKCIDPKLLSMWERQGTNWARSNAIKFKLIYRNQQPFFEIKLTRCIKLNLDFKVPNTYGGKKTNKITIVNPLKNFKLLKIEVLNECPRYYWRFTKIAGNQKTFNMLFTNSDPLVKIWLLNRNDRMDTLISEFIPLSSLNHKIFNGFGGTKQDEYDKFLIFNIKEKVFYHKYWLRPENFKRE